MDSLTLCAVADELRRRALDRRLGEVLIPRREEVVLGLPEGGFLISIQAAEARAHLVDALPAPPDPVPSLQTHFDTLFRGATLAAVEVVDFDRVLHLHLDSVDRVGREQRYRLVVEIMGKHSACCVIDADDAIVAVLKPVTKAINRYRELLPGMPYVAPPAGGRTDPRELSAEAFAAAWPELAAARSVRDGWRSRWHGLSNDLWEHLCRTADLPADLAGEAADAAACDALWQAWRGVVNTIRDGAWQPCLVRDRQGTPAQAWPLALPGSEPAESVSAALDAVFALKARREALKARRGGLEADLRRALQRVSSRLKGLDRAERQAEEADTWQLHADLLLANLHRLRPGQERLEVAEWPDDEGRPLVIDLDPTQPGPQQADALYDKARRARRAMENADAERARLTAERDALLDLRRRLDDAATLGELDALAPRVRQHAGSDSRPGRPKRPKTERERALQRVDEHTSPDGYTIYVARNAADSERMLSRLASPTDLWFHVHGTRSGHVIVRTEGQPDRVPPATIQTAAVLAARQSAMRHSDYVPVIYTQRKYVNKVRGSLGKVLYKNEKTIFVDPTA